MTPEDALKIVHTHPTLEHAVRWALGQDFKIDVVTQDEYTHDTLVIIGDDLVLVYDST